MTGSEDAGEWVDLGPCENKLSGGGLCVCECDDASEEMDGEGRNVMTESVSYAARDDSEG